jgi:hypothetical protein
MLKPVPIRGRRKKYSTRTGVSVTFSCTTCGAADCRDADHQRGCPALRAVSQETMLRLADQAASGWAARLEREAAAHAGA